MKGLKEFRFIKYYRGIHLNCIVVAKTVKDVVKIWGETPYFIKTYGYKYEPRTPMAIENPYMRIAMFERSGEASYFLPSHMIDLPMKYIYATQIIDQHRATCPTYQETIKHYPNGKK